MRFESTAVAVVCEPDGNILELIYDELGLQVCRDCGQEFSNIVAVSDVRKAERFLRAIHLSGAAVNWELHLAPPRGIAPIFFSGYTAGDGLLIIGTWQPVPGPTSATHIEPLAGENAKRTVAVRAPARDAVRFSPCPDPPARDSTGRTRSRTAVQGRHLLEIAVHDLRNPMSGVLAAAQYLIEDASQSLQPHQLAMLHSIESSAQQVFVLLDDMLKIPEMASRRVKLELNPIDIAPLVEKAVMVNRGLAEIKGVTVKSALHKPLPAVAADHVKLSRAVEQLLTSVIWSSDAGGTVDLVTIAQGDQVVITLRHVRAGNPATALRSFFPPAPDSKPKRKWSDERDTLTLVQIRHIVEAHSGKVEIAGDPKQALSIALKLPVSDGARTPKSEPRHRAKRSGGALAHS